jgi:hypothetical protein
MMTDDEIKHLRALCADVRPGATNANFVAAACAALPKILDELASTHRELQAWREAVGRLDDRDAHEVYAFVDAELAKPMNKET